MIIPSSWTLWERDEWSGSGAGTLAIEGEKLQISVTGVGLPYSPQVYQEGLTFNNGTDYTVMFEAQSFLPKAK